MSFTRIMYLSAFMRINFSLFAVTKDYHCTAEAKRGSKKT